MSTEFAVHGFDCCIAVQVDDPSWIPHLTRRLPPQTVLAAPADADGILRVTLDARGHSIYADGVLSTRCGLVEEMLEDFESQLRFALAKFSRRLIFVHAGVVGWKGKALLLPGKSHSGKSSLVAALISAGAQYFSDEHAILDENGLVHPWSKPLSIRVAGSPRQREVAPSVFGATLAERPLPVRLVLSTQYRARARFRPVALPPAAGALELMANTIAVRRYPRETMDILSTVSTGAKTIKTNRPEARRIAPRLLEMLECIP